MSVTPYSLMISVAAGSLGTIDADMPSIAGVAGGAAIAGDRESRGGDRGEPPQRRERRRLWSWVALGGGGALLAAAAVIGPGCGGLSASLRF